MLHTNFYEYKKFYSSINVYSIANIITIIFYFAFFIDIFIDIIIDIYKNQYSKLNIFLLFYMIIFVIGYAYYVIQYPHSFIYLLFLIVYTYIIIDESEINYDFFIKMSNWMNTYYFITLLIYEYYYYKPVTIVNLNNRKIKNIDILNKIMIFTSHIIALYIGIYVDKTNNFSNLLWGLFDISIKILMIITYVLEIILKRKNDGR